MTIPVTGPLWDWTPQAVAQFFKTATVQGRKELRIREGLNAALLEDLPVLAPALARFWIETLAEHKLLDGQVLRLRRDENEFQLPLTRELLLSVCMLDTPLPLPTPTLEEQ